MSKIRLSDGPVQVPWLRSQPSRTYLGCISVYTHAPIASFSHWNLNI